MEDTLDEKNARGSVAWVKNTYCVACRESGVYYSYFATQYV